MSGGRPADSAAPHAAADGYGGMSQDQFLTALRAKVRAGGILHEPEPKLSREALSPREIMETYGHRVEEIEFRTVGGHGRGGITTRFRLRPEVNPAEASA